ncbi:MAG TPA: dephospho-CoA kinase [Puia sp.]|nr:dephospho-CoA kinase [Puia sp.]
MLKVGLTGGIGSGKSTVAGIFEVLGIPVSYADQEAKRVMKDDPWLKEQIQLHFGAEAYTQGQLNRPYLAEQVFPHPDKLELLNSLVHPATIRAGAQWMAEQEAFGVPYAIREAALIFESTGGKGLDHIIGVYAPATLRLHRTLQRDKVSREQVLQRMRSQINEEIKMRLCDSVIYNDDQQALLPQVLELHDLLLRLAATAKDHTV